MASKLLVISSYPPKGITHHKGVVGVATYTKNTLLSLVKNAKQPLSITVLAEKLKDSSNYEENGVVVKRIWKRNSLLSQLSILSNILAFKGDSLLLELELSMLGGPMHLLFLPFMLFLAKSKKIKTTVVFHQVITLISDVYGQLNLSPKGFAVFLYTFLLKAFYKMLLSQTNKAIVFDEALKTSLSTLCDPQKIIVIPHGIEDLDFETQSEARKKLALPLDKKILLYFGYLAWYKGTDLLLDAYAKVAEKDKPLLVIAGGENPNHLDKPFYTKYVTELKKKAQESGAIITGFVDESDISLYFTASDVVILPYRVFMSSSGPLSFTIGAQKPFLVSSQITLLFQTEDMQQSLIKHKVNQDDLTTNLSDLMPKFTKLLTDKALASSLKDVEKDILKSRSWSTIGTRYYEEILA